MLYYTGSLEFLKEHGFLQNVDQSYWYLPTYGKRVNNCIVVCNDGLIEYGEKSLDVLAGQVKKI